MLDSTFSISIIPILDVLSRVLALSYAVLNKGAVFPAAGLQRKA